DRLHMQPRRRHQRLHQRILGIAIEPQEGPGLGERNRLLRGPREKIGSHLLLSCWLQLPAWPLPRDSGEGARGWRRGETPGATPDYAEKRSSLMASKSCTPPPRRLVV